MLLFYNLSFIYSSIYFNQTKEMNQFFLFDIYYIHTYDPQYLIFNIRNSFYQVVVL